MWWRYPYHSHNFRKGSLYSAVWKVPKELSGPTSCLYKGRSWGQTKLLRASTSHICTLPRMKPAQPLWAECLCQTALRQSGEIAPPYIQSELLPFYFMFMVTNLPALHCCEESGSISSKTPTQTLWAAPKIPQNHLCSSLNKSSSPRFSSSEKVQIHIQLYLDHPPWNRFNLLMFFLSEEAKKKGCCVLYAVWMCAIILSNATVSSLVAYKLDELKAL